MHFNQFFSTKAYFKACIEAQKNWLPFFPYQSLLPYKQKYQQTLYLAVCSDNAVGGILNWRISVLCGEKPMLVV